MTVINEDYEGFSIRAVKCLDGYIYWEVTKGDKYFRDDRTIDGDDLQSERHALNDAKKNIDALKRIYGNS